MLVVNTFNKNYFNLFLYVYSELIKVQNTYTKNIEGQIKSIRDFYVDKELEDKLKEESKTKDTDDPLCPWCGRQYSNYAYFSFKFREILQCIECDNYFIVIRDKKEIYTTLKVNKDG
jgi:hypothetical protein